MLTVLNFHVGDSEVLSVYFVKVVASERFTDKRGPSSHWVVWFTESSCHQ